MTDISLTQPVWLEQVRLGMAWLSRQFALLGGFLMLMLATMTVISITGRTLFGAAIEGDYELVEAGLGITVFLFLPEGHRCNGHVVVDIFTNNLAPRSVALLETVGEVFFLIVSLVLIWQLTLGGIDAYDYMEQSMLLELPLWIVFVPGVLSSALIALTSLDRIVTFVRGAGK
ncbi:MULTISPECIES: TRAP transporter small permease [unclassified Oceanobacter]|jgi:TRAP-type C4-dicarboxylate transport system permease small subunit|uniref:TRAP transporter small permease n=1 Tax=unclassified Oceanobacter TaxID=2620260 RepID=UPI0026E25FC8|nr:MULTISPECIES: TRAP transporter small permease [unclassified Oceanobacter]MDO6683366.1 TRAP transporter small permease [Oceanobacter sp. 5_MG-2023]MDP2549044.1 TRAP transporter small permease [Oceanobacter sp. 4_MG-2023]MDP2609923.1 TRAP transporter small permease [Oceanobacter sp. 1_MG-2023]MDP2613195.1 TRAP transporter small permease [Oceanobacter sp. 2_MG-2023]